LWEDSAWHISQKNFRAFISAITDKSITVENAIPGYRELRILPKEFKNMTVQELCVDGPELINKVHTLLRDETKMQYPSKFKLPYKKSEREEELKQIINEQYDIDVEKAKVKIVDTGHWNDGYIKFNFALEVLIAPKHIPVDLWNAGTYTFLGAINDDVSDDGGISYFSGGNYSWTENSKRYSWSEKEERDLTATNIDGILKECGFTTGYYHMAKRKRPCVIYLNLLTPVTEWLSGAGKTQINLTPFASLIAQTVSELAHKMPSCHGERLQERLDNATSEPRDPDQIAIQYLRDYLIQRERDVFGPRGDPMLAHRDRRTQRGVYYHLRKTTMKANNFQPKKDWGQTGRYIAGKIEEVCEELSENVWHRSVTREDLGIVAGTRGQMIFAGESYPIKYDTLKALAHKGVAIVVIEKEGIPDLLAPFAKRYGVAIVGTQGRFTNYQRDLIEEVKRIEGGIVVCLVDDDAAGNAMVRAKATKTKVWSKTPKIGVSKDTVTWLQQNGFPDLKVEDVWEEYTPPSGVLTEEDDPYLQHHRIEIDSIREEVGTKALWKYIVYRLELKEFSPDGFDLDKVVAKPETKELYPEVADEFATNFDDLIEELVAEEKENIIENELTGAEKLEDVTKKELEIKNRLFKIVESEDKLKPILDDMKSTNEKVKVLLKQIRKQKIDNKGDK
jgi:hypothetical protein